MPKLLIFAPCEKILIDEQKNASLVVLLNTISVAQKGDLAIPPDAVSAKEWAVFTMWETDENDFGKEFTQFIHMVRPDNAEFKQAELKFVVNPNDKLAQVRVNIIGFPIGLQGAFTLKMWLQDGANKISGDHTYTISVVHSTAERVLSIL